MDNKQNVGGVGMRKSIYKRWWFWVAVLLLGALTVYLQGYFAWKGEQGKYDIQNAVSQSYWQYMQNQATSLEKQYREDIYGGATPEDTLSQFIIALKKNDFELASKYYVPEKRSEASNNLRVSKDSDHLNAYLGILEGKKNGMVFSDGETYEIDFFDNDGNQIHVEQFRLNPFTKKWLISEL